MKILCVVFLFSLASIAAPDKTEPNFECRKIRDIKLDDLKSAIVKNCDVDKPFSFSVSETGPRESATICCNRNMGPDTK